MRICTLKKAALLSFFLILAFSGICFGQNISVTATVDKNNLTLEDSLQLSIVIKGTKNTPPPQLPSLPDFRVTSAGTSSSTQYINTQRSVSVTYKYRLTPMNTGAIVIGPAKVQINGKNYSTQSITVEVQKTSRNTTTTNKAAFVEASLSNKKAYLGEQLVYTFRLFHRVEAKNLNLQLPFDKSWFSKEELGEPKTYIKVVNGLQYHVQELSIALFPLKKGLVEVPSAIIELDLYQRAQGRSGRDPFNQIFRDPFFGRGVQTEHKVLRSQPLSVVVLPLPDRAPKGFKNLIGQFKIAAELGKIDLEVGDTTTLTVTVSGMGNVRDISFDEPNLKNQFKIYPDKPEFKQTVHDNQIRGEKVFKFALVPLEAGSRTLPAFSLPYFDSESEQYRITKTQPIFLNIKPSSAKEKLNLVQSRQQDAPMTKSEIETLGTDILPIYTELDKFQSDGSLSLAFIGAGFGSPVVLFIISAFLMKRQNRMRYDVAFYRRRNAYKNASHRLKQMSGHSDSKEFARELSEILREYVGDKLNLQGKAITAEEVQVRLKESNYEALQAEETRKLLEKCETLQYAPMTQGSTKQLLGESENLIKVLEKQS
jgi:hypothetical protein